MADLKERESKWLIDVVGAPPVEAIVGSDKMPPRDPKAKSVVDQHGDWEKKEALKEKRLTSMRGKLETCKGQIHDMLDLKVKVVENGKEKEVPFFSDKQLWDPQNEYDPGHHFKNLTKDSLSSPEELARMESATRTITDLKNLMTGTIPKSKWEGIYQEHTEKGRSLDKLADEHCVSEDTIRKVIERQSMILAYTVDPADKKEMHKKAKAGATPDALATEFKKDVSVVQRVLDEMGLAEKGITPELQKDIFDRFDKALTPRKDELQSSDNPDAALATFITKTSKEIFDALKGANPKLKQADVDTVIKNGRALDAKSWDQPIRDEEPVFDDLEIRKEYFDPMVREGVLPDNLVEDRYNQTVQQFKGASGAYDERLKENAKGLSDNHEKLEAIKKVGGVIKNVAKAAGDLAGAVQAAKAGTTVAEQAKTAASVIKAIEAVSLLGCATATAVYEKKAGGVVDQIGVVLEATIGVKDSKLGKLVKLTYVSTVKAGQVGIALCSPDQTVGDAIGHLADGLEAALNIPGNDDMARIAKGVSFAFKQSVNAKAIYDLMQKDPPAIDTANKLIAGAATSACKSILTDPYFQERSEGAQKAKKEKPKDQDAFDEAKGSYETSSGDTVDKLTEGVSPQVEKLGEHAKNRAGKSNFKKDLSEEQIDKLIKAQEAKELEDMRKEIEAEIKNPPEYLAAVRLGLTSDSGDDEMQKLRDEFDNIEKLIADIESRRAYIKMAEALFDAGLGTASEFVGALKIVTAGKDLIKNLIIAADRTMELARWCKLRKNALAAASVQGFAFQKRIDNLDFQADEASARAILALAQVIGATLSATGIGGAAGEVITKTASAAGALLEIALEMAKEAELRAAWAAYRKALQAPYDHILLREAIMKNTTLAKYAMVYAALKEGDAIAKRGMQEAGLTEEVLRNPTSNVQKVVKFLETQWEQDPIVLRRVPLADWQVDKSGALTQKAFLANKHAAMNEKKRTEEALAACSTGGIEGALQALEKAKQAADAAEPAVKTAETKLDTLSATVDKALGDVQAALDIAKDAETTFTQLDTQFKELVKELATEAEDRKKQVQDHLAKLDAAGIKKDLTTLAVSVDTLLDNAAECKDLDKYISAIDEFTTAAATVPAKLEAVEKALDILSKQLGGLQPRRKKDNKIEDGFRQYKDGMKSEADAQKVQTAARRAKLSGDNTDLPKKKIEVQKWQTDLPGLTTKFGTLKTNLDKTNAAVEAHIKKCEQEAA